MKGRPDQVLAVADEGDDLAHHPRRGDGHGHVVGPGTKAAHDPLRQDEGRERLLGRGPQQRLFYTLDTIGLLPQLHGKVFRAIHQQGVRLRVPEDMAAFALSNDLDPVKFMTVYNSPTVRSKAEQARLVATAYGVDGVPSMGVQGRYFTNGNLANGRVSGGANERMLAVVDALLIQVRQAPKT